MTGESPLEYQPALESAAQAKLKDEYGLMIDGEFCRPDRGEYYENINPSDLSSLGRVPLAGDSDVEKSVYAARHAFEKIWSKFSPYRRSQCLYRLSEIIRERASELSVLECLDIGRPISQIKSCDVGLAADSFFYFAGWADKLHLACRGQSFLALGPCGIALPWNAPLLIAAQQLAAALATGNTAVLKPSYESPLCALRLAQLSLEAGIPEGVVNVVTGSAAACEALAHHSDLAKLFFTGSKPEGKRLAKSMIENKRQFSLNLTGSSCNIVFGDIAIDQAVDGIVDGFYLRQGHLCSSSSRLLIEESIAQTFFARLERRMSRLRTAQPLDRNADIGTLHSRDAYEKSLRMIEQLKKEGAHCFEAAQNLPSTGYYLAPMYFSNLATSNTLCRAEVFAPILSVICFRTPDEAVAIANDSPDAYAAGIWTDNFCQFSKTARRIHSGLIWHNSYQNLSPASSLGGVLDHGGGRSGGLQGLHCYLEINS